MTPGGGRIRPRPAPAPCGKGEGSASPAGGKQKRPGALPGLSPERVDIYSPALSELEPSLVPLPDSPSVASLLLSLDSSPASLALAEDSLSPSTAERDRLPAVSSELLLLPSRASRFRRSGV